MSNRALIERLRAEAVEFVVIGEDREMESQSVQDAQDAESLYATLEKEIIPLYYDRDERDIGHDWIARIKESMKTNIPQFSTRRMVKEYVERLYVKALRIPSPTGSPKGMLREGQG